MRLIDIVDAYTAIYELKSKDMPLNISWAFAQTVEKLQSQYDFFTAKRKELIEKYKPVITEDKIQFKDDEEAKRYVDEFI